MTEANDERPAKAGRKARQAEDGKPCRQCRGWGVISAPYGSGVFGTEDCRQCAGTGEES